MGSVYAKPRRSHSGSQSSSLVSVLKRIMLALAAASVLPLLIIYTLPSLKFLLLEVIPSLWRCSCDLFTPTNLFVLLNLIILSIFAMAHLHSTQAAAASDPLMLQSPSASADDCAQAPLKNGAVNRSLSEAFKLGDHKSADMQLVNEVESTTEQIGDLQYDQPAKYESTTEDDDRDDQALKTGAMMIDQEMNMETHLQEAVDNEQHSDDHQIDKRKADTESRKAEKAKIRCDDQSASPESKKAGKATSEASLPGNPPPVRHLDGNCIDSLLLEEGSIFTRVHSRPLPSARFTHKKASKLSGLDRPLSPLKMSRPILKRGDTLEATWKAICESKRHSSPLNRHSSRHTRKVDPCEELIEGVVNKPTRGSPSSLLSPVKQRSKIMMNSSHNKEMEKAGLLYKREPSMPQEELNAKVESFISRFNEQIRIQREKSLLDYMEMVGRGSS